MSDGRKPFDWNEAKRRKASGLTDATFGNIENRQSSGTKSAQPFRRLGQRVAQGTGKSASFLSLGELEDKSPRSQPLGNILERIPLPTAFSAPKIEIVSPRITECECVASYNWVDEQGPTILVPGAPPTWAPLSEAEKLEEDKGDYFKDPNAARWPIYPMEPSVRAIFEMHPDFDTKSIDVVACATTFGNILKFIEGMHWNFDLEVEMIGETLFINRKELTAQECFRNIRGYGYAFPAKYTTWDPSVEGSSTHQRLVQYVFGGLKMLVQYECDGYMNDLVPKDDDKLPRDEPRLGQGEDSTEELVKITESVNLAHIPAEQKELLKVKSAGFYTPQQATFELKTRALWKEMNSQRDLRQLWIRQVPNSIVAFHERGVFNNIRITDVRKDIEEWESKEEKKLKLFAAVIHVLIEKTKALGSRKLLVHRVGSGPLEIRRSMGGVDHLLPDVLRARWFGNSEHSGEGVENRVESSDESKEISVGDPEDSAERSEDKAERTDDELRMACRCI